MTFIAIERGIERVTRGVAVVGGLGLLAAITITCLSILGKLCRRLLNNTMGADFTPAWLGWANPILGEEELVQYAVGFALFTALPWLTLQQGQITINLLEKHFSRTINRALDLLGNLIFCAVVYLMMTQQWYLIFKKPRTSQPSLMELLFGGDFPALAARVRMHDESQILGMKLLPFYTVAELCIILLFIVTLFCVVRGARALMQKESP